MTDATPQWQALVKHALIGAGSPGNALANGQGAADPLAIALARIDWSQREAGLLDAAAIVALWQRAGRRLETHADKPQPCPPDDLPRASRRTIDHLRHLLAGGEQRAALPEWLQAMADAGKRAPEETLPLLLNLGRQQASARPLILRIIGRRGMWLATHNPDWRYAAGVVPDEVWQTGLPGERRWALEQTRLQDPAAGLALLTATWDSESAKDRTDFVRALAAGLGMADEPFLEAVLDDRSKDVRRAAAELLARLPQSRLSQRMVERTTPLLSFTPGRLGGAGKIKTAYPAQYTRDMQRDGIEQKPPSLVKKIGEQTWQLTQLISLTPPGRWSALWNRSPEDLVRAATRSDAHMTLLEGWALAAQRFGDVAWAAALLRAWPTADDIMEGLLDTLPVEQREAHALSLLKSNRGALQGDHPALAALTLCHHAWSAGLSRAVLDRVRQSIAGSTSEHPDWHLRNALAHFALRIAPEVADEATSGWPADKPHWAKPVTEFIALLTFRREMLEAIRE